MVRIGSDQPGPGQELDRKVIRIAEKIIERRVQVRIEWIPCHAGIPGNEFADQWAVYTVQREGL